MKKILYIDMDGVIANFNKHIENFLPGLSMLDGPDYEERSKKVDEAVSKHITFFEELEPIENALGAVELLNNYYDVYFLSTPMCNVPESYTSKRRWIKEKFGKWADKKLILTHRKDLCIGDILIDDRLKHGADAFKGEHIHFGTDEKFLNWNDVVKYLVTDYGE